MTVRVCNLRRAILSCKYASPSTQKVVISLPVVVGDTPGSFVPMSGVGSGHGIERRAD